jgi:OOP family OmpA-OmpF porin
MPRSNSCLIEKSDRKLDMKSKFTLICAAAAALSMAASSAVHAERYLPDGYLPAGGYLLPQVSVLGADKNTSGIGKGTGFGLRYGMPVWNNVDVQLGFSHASASKDGDKVKETQFGADALYLFSRDEVRPFVSAGLGFKQDSAQIDGAAKTSGSSPFWSVGAGVQWMFSNDLGLQADYRRVEGKNKAFPGTKTSGSNDFNLGLIWAFGKASQAAAPVAAVAPVPAQAPAPFPTLFAQAPAPAPAPAPVAAPAPAPAPTLAPAASAVAAAPKRITLAASSLFALNSARIASPVAELDSLATALKSNPQITSVVITGHTDQLGKDAVNRRLSQERAEAVKAYLVGKGVQANRLSAKGVASSQVLTDCKLPTRAEMIKCGAKNRRVEIDPITVAKP